MKKLIEIIKVFDVEPFQIDEGDAFRFRLEICRELDADIYVAKVYRLETYRLQPTFPQTSGIPPELQNDAMIYVVDDMFEPMDLQGTSVNEVIAKFQKKFEYFFKKS